MKVVILAGGLGTRLAPETETIPKPMVEIGGRPILWHIMMHYYQYGFSDFVIALGYKGEVIKKYMVDYCHLEGNITVDFQSKTVAKDKSDQPNWKVQLVETGLSTNTGGRIKRISPYIGNEPFLLTWGDGVSNVNLHELIAFHRAHGKLATLTAVRPPARFGHLELEGHKITNFAEKLQSKEGWINGAFFVLEPDVFNYIAGDNTLFEKEPLETLAQEGELMAYYHESFWQCMDTVKDKKKLEELWASGNAPWKTWEEKQKLLHYSAPKMAEKSKLLVN